MKKIDRLIIGAYIGPFLLTLAVVVFILVTQNMMQRIDDFVGKDLSYWVFAKLLFYFALHTVPMALPLAVLLSSLITFGNLGEHYELTAMKGAGISLIRVIRPAFIMAILVSIGSFWFNNQIIPWANLKAYSLLWDVKQKSPSLSLKEGTFYNGLPNYSIKVNHKYPDGKSLREVMIYNHSSGRGNREVILADSGRMYTIRQDRYLILELFNGQSYHDRIGGIAQASNSPSNQKFLRNIFDKSQMVFNLSSFDMKKTDENLFSGHKIMRNVFQLSNDIDSMRNSFEKMRGRVSSLLQPSYRYHRLFPDTIQAQAAKVAKEPTNKTPQKDSATATPKINNPPKNKLKIDSLRQAKVAKSLQKFKQDSNAILKKDTNRKADIVALDKRPIKPKTNLKIDSIKQASPPPDRVVRGYANQIVESQRILGRALNQARNVKSVLQSRRDYLQTIQKERLNFSIEWHKKFTLAFACLTMFLIGAPLGAIIKKGGLGVPVLISIIFFIFFYVISLTGEKWTKEAFVSPIWGMWTPNFILLVVGAFFLRQAKNDSRLLEADFYSVLREQLKRFFRKKQSE